VSLRLVGKPVGADVFDISFGGEMSSDCGPVFNTGRECAARLSAGKKLRADDTPLRRAARVTTPPRFQRPGYTIFQTTFSVAGAIAQDRESCQFPFLVDEKPTFVPGGSAGERSGGARKISCGVARSNSGRAAPSACVGK